MQIDHLLEAEKFGENTNEWNFYYLLIVCLVRGEFPVNRPTSLMVYKSIQNLMQFMFMMINSFKKNPNKQTNKKNSKELNSTTGKLDVTRTQYWEKLKNKPQSCFGN